MKFSIDSAVFARFPDTRVAVLVLRGVNNHVLIPAVAEQGRIIETKVKTEFDNVPPGQHPMIDAWRKVYRAFGSDPQAYRCSIEALVRQVIKGRDFWGINSLVDVYNLISLKYLFPVGGEDLGKVVGDIRLTCARGDERFIRLGGSELESPEPGEVIYRDDEGALCRRWNWREADRTKLTETTTDAVIVIEALPPATNERLQAAANDCAGLVTQWCGGTVQTHFLDSQNREHSL